jgi:hypothetical protein
MDLTNRYNLSITPETLIWRGSSSETLSEKPEKNEKKLEKAVEDMFKKFPPQRD